MPAKSEKQAVAARIALAAKKGKIPKSKLKGASKEMAKGMSKKQLGHFTHESFEDKLNKVLFESAQHCIDCEYYCTDMHTCHKAEEVIKAHGQDRFNDWMKYPDDLNNCSLYERRK